MTNTSEHADRTPRTCAGETFYLLALDNRSDLRGVLNFWLPSKCLGSEPVNHKPSTCSRQRHVRKPRVPWASAQLRH